MRAPRKEGRPVKALLCYRQLLYRPAAPEEGRVAPPLRARLSFPHQTGLSGHRGRGSSAASRCSAAHRPLRRSANGTAPARTGPSREPAVRRPASCRCPRLLGRGAGLPLKSPVPQARGGSAARSRSPPTPAPEAPVPPRRRLSGGGDALKAGGGGRAWPRPRFVVPRPRSVTTPPRGRCLGGRGGAAPAHRPLLGWLAGRGAVVGRWRWPVEAAAALLAPRSGGTTRCRASPAPCAWRCTRARCACPADTCERLPAARRGAVRGPEAVAVWGPLSPRREGAGAGPARRLPGPQAVRPREGAVARLALALPFRSLGNGPGRDGQGRRLRGGGWIPLGGGGARSALPEDRGAPRGAPQAAPLFGSVLGWPEASVREEGVEKTSRGKKANILLF